MKRSKLVYPWLVCVAALALAAAPRDVSAQTTNESPQTPAGDPTSGDVTVIIVDTPPPQAEVPNAPAPPPPPQGRVDLPSVPSDGVILQRPGQVLLQGKPVTVDFRSDRPGLGFQLLVGGTYSSISGVSYGVGWGGWGWGGYGWGYGGFGVAPYYGEVVTKAYQPICVAPCRATLLSGQHRMAVSLDGGRPINVKTPVSLTENSLVQARYVDRSRLRKAGWATFAAGSVAGLAMMFASVNYRYDPYDPFYGYNQIRNPGVFYSGVGIFISSIIAGAVLAAQDDEATIDVYPAP